MKRSIAPLDALPHIAQPINGMAALVLSTAHTPPQLPWSAGTECATEGYGDW